MLERPLKELGRTAESVPLQKGICSENILLAQIFY